MLLFSLPNIEISADITDQKKYDYLFSVDTLNAEVQSGKPFRDAYRELGEAIEQGNYQPNRSVEAHSLSVVLATWGLEEIQ